MSLFKWKEEYSVKVTDFDDQHKKLINLLNRLFDAMGAGKGKEMVGPILTELIDYTVVHFKAEEKVMFTHAYPDMKAHIEEHELLKKRVYAFKADFDAGKAPLTIEVMNFLKDWLTNHIVDTDKRYGPYMNARGIN